MAEVLGSGFDLNSRGAGSRFSAQCFVLAGAILACSIAGSAQTAPTRQARKDAPPPAAVRVSVAPEAGNPAPPAPAPSYSALPLMAPARPPVVDWDGKLLTIDAENSTLSDVLLAIRSRTGASIEMPGSASAERIAIHVGPAPIRDVLASLLYGTNFNYVIQASEDDESGLAKVILTSRDGSGDDDSSVGEVRTADRNVRLMPGYSAPGKRDFEVAHARAMQEAAENAAAADTANQDASPVAGNDPVSNSTPDADSQPVAANSDSGNSSPAPDASLTATEQPLSNTAAGIASAGSTASTAGDPSNISNMEQNLQKMYEQRRQLQAQQNQPPRQAPPTP